MKQIITLLNKMVAEGIIESYAICGATALIYYSEPIQTQDVDVLVVISQQNKNIISLTKAYDFLKDHGAKEQGMYLIINNTPLQLLMPYNDLVSEAINHAIEVNFDNSKVKILNLEYLMAIMIQTSRTKDIARLEELLKLKVEFNNNLLENILSKHDLKDKWNQIKKSFKSN